MRITLTPESWLSSESYGWTINTIYGTAVLTNLEGYLLGVFFSALGTRRSDSLNQTEVERLQRIVDNAREEYVG